jgi:hypothetical protein
MFALRIQLLVRYSWVKKWGYFYSCYNKFTCADRNETTYSSKTSLTLLEYNPDMIISLAHYFGSNYAVDEVGIPGGIVEDNRFIS